MPARKLHYTNRRHDLRVIECNACGQLLSGANDEELSEIIRRHTESEHPDRELDSDQAAALVGREAYDASDS